MTPPPFQRFLDEQRDPVWRFLVAAVGRDAADDCFQETFLAALRAYPKLRDDVEPARLGDDDRGPQGDRPSPLARRARRSPSATPPSRASTPRRPTAPATRRGSAFASCRARQRAVLLLRYAGDMTHAQIARALGCSEEASRQAAREGLARLRKELQA